MENIRKSKLAVALTAALGLGAFAGSAQAVNVANDGIGELSYIPYYSVTKGQEEFIKLVNTSARTVAVKIVFRRGTDSREVRDFNIIMSPFDEWVAKVVPSANGNAKVVTKDTTCTIPNKDQWTKEADGSYSVDFDNTLFGSNVTVESENVITGFKNSLVKEIKEGYVYVAVMGINRPDITIGTVNSVPYLAKHINGVPRDCGSIDWGFANRLDDVASQFTTPESVLRVTSSLVDVKAGSAVEVPVTTFANAFNIGANITSSSVEQPDESFVDVESDIFIDSSATLATGTLDKGQRALSTTVMANQVVGTYDTTNSQTSNWIVNFPTKRSLMQLFPAVQPFNDSVVTIAKASFDEEEETSVTTTKFSPALTKTVVLPWEVNVVGFSNNNSLVSGLFTDSGQGFAKGWMALTFPKAVAVSSVDGKVTYTGMPVIGFELNEGAGIASSQSLSYTKGILAK